MRSILFTISICTACTTNPPSQAESAFPGSADRVVASWNDGQLMMSDLEEELGDQLKQMDIDYQLRRHALLRQAMDSTVESRLLDGAREAGGYASVGAMLDAKVYSNVATPTEQQLDEAFRRLKQKNPGAKREEATAYLTREIQREMRQEKYVAFVEDLKRQEALDVKLTYPSLPRVNVNIADADAMLGAKDAPVTIVEFGEYECHYCVRAVPVIDRILKTYPNEVQLVFKDFPLAGHRRARNGARAAHCAGLQGRYWEMHRELMSHQGRLGNEAMERYAQDLGLDLANWRTCLKSGLTDEWIQSNIEEGRRVGVRSTPTFFVNGVMVQGMQSYEQMSALVQRELDRSVELHTSTKD